MVIRQGEVYWIDAGGLPAPIMRPHPFVVIQNNLTNSSAINSIIVCVISSNPRQARIPSNVMLQKGEGGLAKPCAVNVSQIFAVNRQVLVKKFGTLSARRVDEILDGLMMLLKPAEL